MSVSIVPRKKNAGEALFNLAGDISEHAALSNTTLNELFANHSFWRIGTNSSSGESCGCMLHEKRELQQ